MIKPRIYADKRGSETAKKVSSVQVVVLESARHPRRSPLFVLIRVYPRKSAA
jgi:hypothetical protein